MYTLEDANVMTKAFISEQKQECLAKKNTKTNRKFTSE